MAQEISQHVMKKSPIDPEESDIVTQHIMRKSPLQPEQEKLEVAFAEEGGPGSLDRASLEKRLLLKLDLRFSVLIVIYILNVGLSTFRGSLLEGEAGAGSLGSAATWRGASGVGSLQENPLTTSDLFQIRTVHRQEQC